jgi:hypothetical protein
MREDNEYSKYDCKTSASTESYIVSLGALVTAALEKMGIVDVVYEMTDLKLNKEKQNS